MTNKDFNHRCGTVFGLAILFVLFVGLMFIGFELLRSIIFVELFDVMPSGMLSVFDEILNALKGA